MTADEIHDYAYALKNALENVEKDPRIRATDRRLLLSFHKHIKAQGVSLGRQAKYLNNLRTVSLAVRVPWRKAKRRDIEDLITKLADHEIVSKRTKQARHYSPETMADFHMVIKRFQKFVRYGDTDKDTSYPEEVRWLRKNVKESERRAPLWFTDQEVEAMIKAAGTLRDKAFVAAYGEMGGRPAEFLLLRVGDLTFDDDGVIVRVRKGKTGFRTVRLIASAPYLADHVSVHPYHDDPQAPLWLTTATNHLNQPMSWLAADKLVKDIAGRAGIKQERAHMYMFRHGSATRNARFLTDSELRLMYGWSPTSRVPGRYIHLSGGDLDEKYRAVYTGKPVEPAKPDFAPVICPRCGSKASPGMRFCPKCASPLERAERAKMAVQEESTKREVSELRGLLEKYLRPPSPKGKATGDPAPS